MDIIKCSECHENVEINIECSIMDDGEIFECPHCRFQFLYIYKVNKILQIYN